MEASVTFLLENLKELVVSHVNLVVGAKEELEQLKDELETMKAALKDSSEMHYKTHAFIERERQIREVIYEVEDVIDAYVIETASKKVRKTANLIQKIVKPNRLAERVKHLREKVVKPLFEKTITEFGSSSTTGDASQSIAPARKDKRKKDPRQNNVVGFEDETDQLIAYLNEESDQLEVISIIGMPGLGKTTVAWKIYQDSRIKFEFPTLIWVFISQEFNKRKMLLTILKSFTQQDMSAISSDDVLAKKAKEFLKRGKFLMFMDDVWTVEVWKEIEEVLPTENKLGKILITSRHKKVADFANRRKKPHMLRFLSPEESWELLQLEVYGKLASVDKGLEQIGQYIAEQCNGLPLSIIVIGGILVEKTLGQIDEKKEWKKVSESVKDLIHGDAEQLMGSIISLSYTELPYDLRDCFLYLGMFPEDPEIPAWKLTQLWIAEGFIKQNPSSTLEDVALDNLKDLINRNLVMVHKTKPDGEVKTCRVHDTIREFCKTEVALTKQNLFKEITRTKSKKFSPPLEGIGKYRRLCIHSYVHDFLKAKPEVSKARSLVCLSKAPIILQAEDITTIIKSFTLLRVLEANTIKFPNFPSKITTLLHLRYLTLSGEKFEVLPEAIIKLWNLQTLNIDTLSYKLEIKADLWQMMQLRHLKTKASVVLLKKDGKGSGGKNLQTLGRLSPQSCSDHAFEKAQNLKALGIRGDISMLSKSECLTKLNDLVKLKLVHDAFPLVASENPVTALPQHMMFPPKLRILVLSGTNLEWHHMSTLRQLDALEVLKLKDNAFLGNFWDANVGSFRCLEFLYIERTDLMHWVATSDAFPALKHLVIKNCEKLQGVPPELIENLENLYLERVNRFAVQSAKKIEDAKLQIPQQQGGRRLRLVIAPGDQLTP